MKFTEQNFDNPKSFNNARKKKRKETKFKKFEEQKSHRNDSTVRGHESKRSSVDIIYVANSKPLLFFFIFLFNRNIYIYIT